MEKGHGRIETRRYWQSDRIGWFAGKEAWESLRSVGGVEALREMDGKISMERRYSLSSLPLDAQRFGKAVRSHSGVENQLHWVLDVVFNEEQSRCPWWITPSNGTRRPRFTGSSPGTAPRVRRGRFATNGLLQAWIPRQVGCKSHPGGIGRDPGGRGMLIQTNWPGATRPRRHGSMCTSIKRALSDVHFAPIKPVLKTTDIEALGRTPTPFFCILSIGALFLILLLTSC